jgi:hypothetical protein
MPGYIHHIEWCVSDLDALRGQLVDQFGFREISGRASRTDCGRFSVRQRVLKSGLTVFILTEKKPLDSGLSNGVGQKSQYMRPLKKCHFIFLARCLFSKLSTQTRPMSTLHSSTYIFPKTFRPMW